MKQKLLMLNLIVLCVLSGCLDRDYASPLESNIHKTFKELKRVRMMKPGEKYRVSVNGIDETGVKEKFLRRRNGEEIWSSKLSTGCGDYSLACISKLSELGEKVLLIDAAEISEKSLKSRFAGHSVVAVLESEKSKWWLIDPSARKILSENWDKNSKIFEANGKQFWIGYAGDVANYSIKDPLSLKNFYNDTLNSIPSEIIERVMRGDVGILIERDPEGDAVR